MSLVCWKCGASMAGMLLQLSRGDLHVCRLCRHHDARRAGAVMAQASRSAFDTLFGGEVPKADPGQSLEDLFKK